MKYFTLTLILTLLYNFSISQDGTATIIFILKNTKGGLHKSVDISCSPTGSEETFTGKTDYTGRASIELPSSGEIELTFSNSQKKRYLNMPGYDGVTMEFEFKYDGGDDDWSKKYPPTTTQKKEWQEKLNNSPDSNKTKLTKEPGSFEERFVAVKVHLDDAYDKPLKEETMYFNATKSNKVFYGTSDKNGNAYFLLPKGEKFTLNFKLDKNYSSFETALQLGTSHKTMNFSYLGTKEIIRRKEEEEKRLKEVEERRKKEEEEYAKYIAKMGKSLYESRAKEFKDFSEKPTFKDNVILKVFNRNKHWKDKLIVCDLTGSMSPYAKQLAYWYTLNHMHDQNMQFVFFNDGDHKSDYEKKIGETGGIYYGKNNGLDSLANLMATVMANGSGGDGPENNMEALIKGTKMANNYKEIIMIVDNYAPVKDIELLSQFNAPVRIILCGMDNFILEDYLKIAYQTKGSIHTMEEDIMSLYKVTNGKTITIGDVEYKQMNGRFVSL